MIAQPLHRYIGGFLQELLTFITLPLGNRRGNMLLWI